MIHAMILAAGEGVRFRPHTSICPKPSIPFLTIPLIGYSQYHLKNLGIQNLVTNTFHLPHKIVNSLNTLRMVSQNKYYSHEKGQILGSGGGLRNARHFFNSNDEIILINGDELLIPKDPDFLSKALEFHRSSGNLSTLIVTKNSEVGSKFGGVWTQSNHQVLGFGKKPTDGYDIGWHFIGIQILSHKIFDYLNPEGPSDILYDGLTQAIKTGQHRVQVFPIDGLWFETGNLNDYLDATENCLKILSSERVSLENNYLREIFKFYGLEQFNVQRDEQKILFSSTNFNLDLLSPVEGFLVLGPDINHFNQQAPMARVVIENQNAMSMVNHGLKEGTAPIKNQLFLDDSDDKSSFSVNI